MKNDTIFLQKQIMENSKSINEYFKDLYDWEKDISKRDKIVKGESIKNPIPINKNLIKQETENSNKKENINEENNTIKNRENKEDKNTKLKRDTTSMKDYYKEWDKFKVDSEEEKSDSENDKPKKPKGMNNIFSIFKLKKKLISYYKKYSKIL